MTTQLYRLRPGRLSDVRAAVGIWKSAFAHDQLLEIMFPTRHERPEMFHSYLERLFHERYWSLVYRLTVLVDEADTPVGFTWWKVPKTELSFYQYWLSPATWFSAAVRALQSIRNYLFPIPHLDDHSTGIFTRVMSKVEGSVMNTDRRKQAWYLSTLAVLPKLQAKGLGSLLLRDGLRKVDQRGVACWLVALTGVEGYYNRFGFVEVARTNVGELAHWTGGALMFRE